MSLCLPDHFGQAVHDFMLRVHRVAGLFQQRLVVRTDAVGLVHTMRGTAGHVHDVIEADGLLHGEETEVFGYTKVSYKELRKNTAQVMTLFALSNLWMARLKLRELPG